MLKSIKASLTYSVDNGVKPINETMEEGNHLRKYTGQSAEHAMTLYNGRTIKDDFVLDNQGFEFVEYKSRVSNFYNRIGETYQVSYNSNHYWYYFPKMTRDEVLIFKVYDSEKDGRARFTAHTSFSDPTSPPNAKPRESIEIRTLAFF